MDAIDKCLSIDPVSCLSSAFSICRSTWDFVKQVLASQEQQKVVVARISELLCALDAEYRAERLLGTKTSTALDELYEFVQCSRS